MEKQFDEFCTQVLEHIPRATSSEREEIRVELLGHLEDKAEILRERGCEDVADKAVAAMGNAAEIGTAWNEQLSTLWLWIGRLAWMLGALLFFAVLWALLSNVGFFFSNPWGNFEARWGNLEHIAAAEDENLIWTGTIDYRMELRDNVVRFHRVRLERSETVEGGYDLVLCMAAYAKNPLHDAPNLALLQRITCSAAEEAFSYDERTNYIFRNNATYWSERVPIDQNGGTVTITAEHYGQIYTMDVELGGAT